MKFANPLSIIGKGRKLFDSNLLDFHFFSLMPNRALSHDGKKHFVTVPVRLRKTQNIDSPVLHEGQ